MENETINILALYPNGVGLGYACIELPKNLIDYGIVRVHPKNNERLLSRVSHFINFFKPTVVVVKDWDNNYSRRSERVEQLVKDIATHAETVNVPVRHYSRQQIQDVFEVFGAKTKNEISNQLGIWFPELAPRMPKKRKAWKDEDYNMGVFDALSLAIAHEYLKE